MLLYHLLIHLNSYLKVSSHEGKLSLKYHEGMYGDTYTTKSRH